MTNLNILSTLVLPWLFLMPPVSGETNAVSCISGAFQIGTVGEVTCDFNVDINATQHDFNVAFYAFNSTKYPDIGTYVLLCNWARTKQLECKVEDGFSFDYQATSEVKVVVNKVNSDVEGLYVCQLVPDKGIPVQPCNLTVEERQAEHITEISTQIVQQLSSPDKPGIQPITVIFIIISVIEAIALLIFIVSFRKRLRRCIRRRRSQWSKKRSNDGPEEEENTLMYRINYPANTANKQTYTYTDTADKNFQIGTQEVITFDVKQTQVDSADKTFLTGVLKGKKDDVVLAPRPKSEYYTLRTPPVQLPDEMAKEKGYVNCKPVDHVYNEPSD